MWILPLAFFVSCKSNEGQWENKQISFPENIVFTKAGKDTIYFDFDKSEWKFFIYADTTITSRSRDTGKIRWNRVFKRIE